jgi:DNA-binding transcriptional MerR regulator
MAQEKREEKNITKGQEEGSSFDERKQDNKIVLEAELVEDDVNSDDLIEEQEEEVETESGGVIFFTPKATAEKLNIPVDLLRNYYIKEFENESYLKPHIYKGSGQRRKYSEEAIKVLSNIVKLKNIDGYSFAQIKEMLRREGSNKLPDAATNMVILSQKDIVENISKMVATVERFTEIIDKKGITKEDLLRISSDSNMLLLEEVDKKIVNIEEKMTEAVQKGIEMGIKKGVKQYRTVYEKKLTLFQRIGARLLGIPVNSYDDEDQEEETVKEG